MNALPGEYDVSRVPAHDENQEGTAGFNPELAGRGKSGHSNTTSFGPDVPVTAKAGEEASGGQEEGGRLRQPNTSSAGRIEK